MTGQRVDARRNYARILAVAEQEVAERGADASLEQIARTAGVGSATVRRHFPGRRALLEAVFSRRITTLGEKADELSRGDDARDALLEWLRVLTDYAATVRGLANALVDDDAASAMETHACSSQLADAVHPLLRRAQQESALASGTTAADLHNLVAGIVLATEHHPAPAAEAKRLLDLAIRGISPGD